MSALPPLPKGALVSIDPVTGAKRSISFQYNPETLRRTLEPNLVGGKPGSRSAVVRYAGAPSETLTLDCRFAAPEAADGQPGVGIAPQLAALAILMYPASADVQRAQALLDQGRLEVLPEPVGELLFVLGSDRVIPCQLLSYSIVEELYAANLVPVLATVTLTLRATSYSDVDATAPAYGDFLTYQRDLEQLAAAAFETGGPS